MKSLGALVVVAIGSVFNMYIAIPAGYGMGLTAAQSGAAAIVGSVCGTVAMVFLGDRIVPIMRDAYRRVLRKADEEVEKDSSDGTERQGVVRRLGARFGAPGVGLVGPLFLGGFGSAIAGVAIGIPRLKLAFWLGLGQGLVVAAYASLVNVAVA